MSDAQLAEAPSAAQALELGDWGGNLGLRTHATATSFARLGPGYTKPGPESGVMRGRAGPRAAGPSPENGNWDQAPGGDHRS